MNELWVLRLSSTTNVTLEVVQTATASLAVNAGKRLIIEKVA